ncbi:MAG: cytochrome d ubiquinol oxidase subunit II [Gammaproteobacteria bacterium]|nr:cytochrome d ubiquinol oxidase subunit II [Gammaproteobacteria bacterium]
MHWLPLIWIGIIGFGIIMYLILDGFTLGTGMMMPFLSTHERNLAMSAILPTWDGNQTWLVLGAATLYGAFPIAFSTILPILYLPLILMVIALLFRGVVFEFRLKSTKGVKHWDMAFIIASLTVTFIQGLILGNTVEGFPLMPNVTVPPDNNFLTPFSLFTAISLVFGYSLLGSTRLILKTEGALQQKMYRVAKVCAIALAIAMIVVSLWTPLLRDNIAARWFDPRYQYYLAILPTITGGLFYGLFYLLFRHRGEASPYWLSVALFVCAYIGFIISIFPYIVPYHITIFQAAAPDNTLKFLLVGGVIMLPLLLIYTGYSYHIFKGKVKDVIHY